MAVLNGLPSSLRCHMAKLAARYSVPALLQCGMTEAEAHEYRSALLQVSARNPMPFTTPEYKAAKAVYNKIWARIMADKKAAQPVKVQDADTTNCLSKFFQA